MKKILVIVAALAATTVGVATPAFAGNGDGHRLIDPRHCC